MSEVKKTTEKVNKTELNKQAQPGGIYRSIQNYLRATVLISIYTVSSPLTWNGFGAGWKAGV